jgi:hypothetical protein
MVSDMAKRKSANPFLGRWLIEETDQWDVEDESEEFQAFIKFERSNTGRFQFTCVHDGDESGFTATKKS